MGRAKKVVLAYSGGVDTSVCKKETQIRNQDKIENYKTHIFILYKI